MLRFISFSLILGSLIASATAEPLSKKTDIDFFRDVPSRNLKGLATRSDGRLVAGPTLAEIGAPPPADILWSLEPTSDPTKFLLGTGPDGKIVEITFNPANATYGARDVVKLDDPQVFAVKRLGDGAILAGTSPKGALYLVRDGKVVACTSLPVDSIFDLMPPSAGGTDALVATGNPGRIYRVNLAKFEAAGINHDKIKDPAALADRGITLFGEIRDRNVRRFAIFSDGRVVAGSAPKGNLYVFPRDGGAPTILQENRDAEVTDLMPLTNGDLYATIVFSNTSGESRITPAKSENKDKGSDLPPPATQEKFGGRSTLVWFPANGFPETLTSRSGTAFYRLAQHGDTILIAGGEAGDLLGYDLKAKLSLTFAGSISSQLNSIVPLASSPDKFLVLRNNAAGLALLDFNANGPREAETKRIDLGVPAQLGALRFNRLRELKDSQVSLDLKLNNGSDELEGWTQWTSLKSAGDGWRADGLRGRYIKLRLKLSGQDAATVKPELDKATLYVLPQNRRPQLQEFHFITPNYGIIPAVDQPPSPNTTLSQLLSPSHDDDNKRHDTFLRSQIVPQTGAQVAFWTVNDPDGDNTVCTFSLRREGDTNWTDLAVNTRENYAQFDTLHLPDGVYFTRIVATETSPRPIADRLSATFETDDLIIDHTPPEVITATARRDNDRVIVSVHGRDALSLLDGMEVVFNNGIRETVEQPDDGIRDGREETFTLDLPAARVSNATSAEVTLYDSAGNSTSRRLMW